MQIFLDTCNFITIRKYHEIGLVDGAIISNVPAQYDAQNIADMISGICDIVNTFVSVQVCSSSLEEMLTKAEMYSKMGKQIVVQLPITEEGLHACRILSSRGIKVHMTYCFSASQALIASKVGAAYVSPFIEKTITNSAGNLKLLADICAIYALHPFIETKVIASSIKDSQHFTAIAKLGVDVALVSPDILKSLINHQVTPFDI